MELRDLLKLGTSELVDLTVSGKLRGRHVWTAMKGAQRYRHAMEAGDIASEADQASRAAKCAACPLRTNADKPKAETVAHYCGPVLDERPNADPPTCGCLVGVTPYGATAMYPGGKLEVASEYCWKGEWGAVPRAEAANAIPE